MNIGFEPPKHQNGKKQIIVRPLTHAKLEEHIEEMIEICNSAFGEGYWSYEHFRRNYEGKWELSCVAIHNNAAVGFKIVTVYDLLGKKTAHGNMIAVKNDYRKFRVGLTLMDFSENLCCQYGIEQLTAETNESIAPAGDALNLYYGYTRVVDHQLILEYLSSKGKSEMIGQYACGDVKLYIKKL